MEKKICVIASCCLLLDQITKYCLDKLLYITESIPVVPSFFSITYVKNDGAAWSLLAGRQFFLIFVSIAALLVIYHFFIKEKHLNKLEIVSYGILIGGIFGNLIDRILRGHVIDFLDFRIFDYNFPVFNIADICIVMSVCLMVIGLWKEDGRAKVRGFKQS